MTVEQPSDVDLDDSLQIIPGETPPAVGEEVPEVGETEGIIQPEVGPPETATSVIVLKFILIQPNIKSSFQFLFVNLR